MGEADFGSRQGGCSWQVRRVKSNEYLGKEKQLHLFHVTLADDRKIHARLDFAPHSARLHARLHPYIHSNAIKFHRDGYPHTMTPLPIAFPDDPRVHARENSPSPKPRFSPVAPASSSRKSTGSPPPKTSWAPISHGSAITCVPRSMPAGWAVAHTTQFADPGWIYMDKACGQLDPDTWRGSHVALLW